ncbi:MAG: ribulose-phosphate 3-epimerase [bacterium]|nr:ribulose-phosphate 3-epimerase [bacterium]
MSKHAFKKYIAPAFLVQSKEEFLSKFEYAKKKYDPKLLHIDVMDGKFVSNTCWCNPNDIKKLTLSTPFEAHLMVLNPEKNILLWKKAGARRIIFHIEATQKPEHVIRAIHRAKMESSLAINPDTPIERIRLLLPLLDGILIMGVNPGFGGQLFQKKVLKKITEIRRVAPKLFIIVDGGVTFRNAPTILKHGARQLVMGSAIFGKTYVKKNFRRHTSVQ